MKKIKISILSLLCLLGSKTIFAQDKIQLEKYDYVTAGGANIFQGKPSIEFPLMKLDIPNTSLSVGISLDYSTDMASAFKLFSDVGKGWNLTNVGNVVRNKTSSYEDYYGISSNTTDTDSDVYFYSCPGTSGQFYITKESGSGNLIAVSINASNDKITITPDPVKAHKISSFTITDINGNRFVFDKVNINLFKGYSLGNDYSKSINSGFLLSKIFSPNNIEVANIEYETTTQLYNQTVGNLQLNKIKKINILNKGTIEYIYKNLSSPIDLKTTVNEDRYTLEKLIMKDSKGSLINQYVFNRTPMNYLQGYDHLNKENQIIEKFLFDYNQETALDPYSNGVDGYGYATNSDLCNIDDGTLHLLHAVDISASSYGILKGVTLPSGGRIEYEFEPNAIPLPQFSSPCTGNEFCKYINSDLNKLATLTINQNIGINNISYTLPNGYDDKIILKYTYNLNLTPPLKPGETYFGELYSNNNPVSPYIDGSSSFNIPCNELYYASADNSNSVNFTFSAPRKATVTIDVYGFKNTPRDHNEYGRGLRIKSIKNFDKDNSQPRIFVKYDYSLFTDPLTSSGEVVDNGSFLLIESFDDWVKPDELVGYQQVKVTNMIDGSYSKYYYHGRYDSVFPVNSSYTGIDKDMKSYLQTSGLLQKKEDFSAANQLLSKTENSFVLKEIPINGVFSFMDLQVKKVIISSQQSATLQSVNSQSQLSSTSEAHFDDVYGNLIYSKETSPDGNSVEKNISYPADKNLQKLINANMVSVPLETSTKRNGKLLGKEETKFDDPSHLYPTSVLISNAETLNMATVSTMDVYDDKGNLVQITGKDGIPITTIWGYYQTEPVVQIKGVSYNQVKDLQVVKDVVTASNADADNPATEGNLLVAIENLMKNPAMQNYTISASTYDPLIGVTNSISPNGIRIVTVYDSSNRASKITDANGKVLKQYQYNYQH